MSVEGFIKVGKVTSSRGLKGQIRIYSYVEIENLSLYEDFYLERVGCVEPSNLVDICFHIQQSKGDVVVATIEGVDSREEADSLRGSEIYVGRNTLPKIEDRDTYYAMDLVGLCVVDDSNDVIGKVIEVNDYGAGDNVTIEFSDNTVAEYPFLRTIFTEVDLQEGRISFVSPMIV